MACGKKKTCFLFSVFLCSFSILFLDLFRKGNLMYKEETWKPSPERVSQLQSRSRIERNITKIAQSEGDKTNIKSYTVIRKGFIPRWIEAMGRDWNENMSSKDLLPGLRAVKNNYLKMNKYRVTFRGKKGQNLSPQELLCELKTRVNMSMIRSSDLPHSASYWSKYLPTRSLQEEVGRLEKCAMVSSAGSIISSKLGSEIDSHDAVLRFNGAPTKGFETDVGSKVSFRLINSQLITVPELKFLESPLYNKGILVMWDPAPYEANVHQWYKSPEYRFFERYLRYRKKNPEQSFYILHPHTAWQLWDIIQENSPEPIQPDPPSSGFLGILLLMNLCNEVNVYEFLPSKRRTDLCHYYQIYKDSACTMGGYHPLMYEKNMVKKLNLGDKKSIYSHGRVKLRGIHDLKC